MRMFRYVFWSSERAIFDALDRMRLIEDEAKGKTKAARRAVQRRTPKIGSVIPDIFLKNQSVVDVATSTLKILPFDEMDDMSDE